MEISTLTSWFKSERNHAIFIILAGFMANFMVFGIIFTFGVFQDFYTSSDGPLSGSPHAVVSMIGTVASATCYSLAILNTTMAGLLKTPGNVMLAGSIIMGLGLIMAGFCQNGKPYQFVLSQGLLCGIGASFTYMPPVVCAPPYYTRHRGVAMGILFAGSGLGALALAPLTRYLISTVGWRWSLRILGFMVMTSNSAASFLVHQHPSIQGSASLKDAFNYKVVDSTSLGAQLSAGFFQSAGYLICLNYMSTYGETLNFTSKQGANFIAINNGVNAVFKIVIGHLADRVGRLRMIIICNFLSAASVFTLWLIGTRETFISFVVIYGVFSGAIISLLPTCLSEIFGNKNYQSISGLMYFARGLGNFIGSPVAGLLIKSNSSLPSSYQNAIIYNGVLLAVSTICLAVLGLRVKFLNTKELKN